MGVAEPRRMELHIFEYCGHSHDEGLLTAAIYGVRFWTAGRGKVRGELFFSFIRGLWRVLVPSPGGIFFLSV